MTLLRTRLELLTRLANRVRAVRAASILAQGSGDDLKLGTGSTQPQPHVVRVAHAPAASNSTPALVGAATGASHSAVLAAFADNTTYAVNGSISRVYSCGSNYFCQAASPLTDDDIPHFSEVPISSPETATEPDPVVSDPQWQLLSVASGDFVNLAVARRRPLSDETTKTDIVRVFAWGAGSVGNGTILNVNTPQPLVFGVERTQLSPETSTTTHDDDEIFDELNNVRDIASRGDTSAAILYDDVLNTTTVFVWGCLGTIAAGAPPRSAESDPSVEDINLSHTVRIAAPAPMLSIPDSVLSQSNANEHFDDFNAGLVKLIPDIGRVGVVYISKPPSNAPDIGLQLHFSTLGRPNITPMPRTPYENYPESVFEVDNCVVPPGFYSEDESIVSALNVNFSFETVEKMVNETKDEFTCSISTLDLGLMGGDLSLIEIVDARFVPHSTTSGFVALRNKKKPSALELFVFEKGKQQMVRISDTITGVISRLQHNTSINCPQILAFDASNGKLTTCYTANDSEGEPFIGCVGLAPYPIFQLGSMMYHDVLETLDRRYPRESKRTEQKRTLLQSFFSYIFPTTESELNREREVREYCTKTALESGKALVSALLTGDSSNFVEEAQNDSQVVVTNMGMFTRAEANSITSSNESVNVTILGDGLSNHVTEIPREQLIAKVAHVWDHCVVSTTF